MKAKSIISVFLVLIIALGCFSVTAFSEESGTVIYKEPYSGQCRECVITLVGTAAEDGRYILSRGFTGYEFTAEKPGLYSIEFSAVRQGHEERNFAAGAVVGNEPENGVSTGQKPIDILWDSPECGPGTTGRYVYYFEQGESAIIASVLGEEEAKNLGVTSQAAGVEYLGEAVSLERVSDKVNYLLGEDMVITGDSVWLREDVFAVTLDTGDEYYISGPFMTCEGESGEMLITASFAGCETEFTVNAAKIDDVIESIDFPANYAPAIAVYYDGETAQFNDFPAAVTVRYKDGSSAEFKAGTESAGDETPVLIKTPDGEERTAYIAYDSGSKTVSVFFAEKEFSKTSCSETPVSGSADRAHLFGAIKDILFGGMNIFEKIPAIFEQIKMYLAR